MANIRVDLDYTLQDGAEIKFRSPVDCSQVAGLIVYYPGIDGNITSKEFVFADAHGNNVGDIDHLFAEDVVVKVILDVAKGMAFVQNADTNAYIEDTFLKKTGGTMTGAIAMSGNKIAGLGTPTADTDASTKEYVDEGLRKKATIVAGTPIPEGANADDYTTPGDYRCTSGLVAKTLLNFPYDGTGFKLSVFNTTTENQIMQEIKCNAGSSRVYRRVASYANGVWTFQSWYQAVQAVDGIVPVSLGGSGAKTATDARTNFEIAKVLWENASPLSAFGGQTITVTGMSAYKCIAVILNQTNGDSFVCVVHKDVAANYPTTPMAVHDGDGLGPYVVRRGMTPNFAGNKITFGKGYQNGTENNNRAIPIAVIGLS